MEVELGALSYSEESPSVEMSKVEVQGGTTQGLLAATVETQRILEGEEIYGDSDRPPQSSPPQLGSTIRLLSSLQGAILQLPSLALLAIVNDRVAIPPAYLPAYGAVAFLPHSLKPLWATLSTTGLSSEAGRTQYTKVLLALLLFASGLTYVGTALWIPVGGVIQCFVWGFLRGVTSAWSQFLLDQLLIRQARRDSSKRKDNFPYQAVSSLFQSQAATYRHVGSFLASVATFGVFAWRQGYKQGKGKQPPLNATVVSGLLLGSACICFAGSVVVMFQLKSSVREAVSESSSLSDVTSQVEGLRVEQQLWSQSGDNPHQSGGFLSPMTTQFSAKYDALSTQENGGQRDDDHNTDSLRSSTTVATTTISTQSLLHDDTTRAIPDQKKTSSPMTTRDKSDMASLVLLQMLLVGGALQRPIAATTRGPAIWATVMTLLAVSLVGTVAVSSFWKQNKSSNEHDPLPCDNLRDHANDEQHQTTTRSAAASSIIPARRLGLYLMLRHSVPIASILVYSYVYAIFGRDEPVFLQCLFIIESAVSVFATWFYGRFLATQFHSGWGVIGLIAVLSVVASLLSLLDVIVVRVADAKAEIDTSLRWLVISVSIVTYFMGQVGFMPSVILATANVVSASDRDDTIDGVGDERSCSVHQKHGEGIQYATYISCIDFGSQMGDWISVPIIAALGITRENHWANLDKYIVLCALVRIASVSFLYLIRPLSQNIV